MPTKLLLIELRLGSLLYLLSIADLIALRNLEVIILKWVIITRGDCDKIFERFKSLKEKWAILQFLIANVDLRENRELLNFVHLILSCGEYDF